MIFLTPVIVKYMKNNLVIANKFCQSLHPSLYRVSTVLSLSWWFIIIIIIIIIILIFSIVSYAPTVVSHILKWMTKKDIISHRKGNIVTFDTNMFHFHWSKLQNTLCTLSVVFCSCNHLVLSCNHPRKIPACTLCKAKWATQVIDQRSNALMI